MPNQDLFHPRTISKALQSAKILKDGKIPPKPLSTLKNWQRMIEDGSIKKQSEGNLHPVFFSDLCETVLNYSSFSNKDKKTGQWTLINEGAIKRTGRVDIGFGIFNDKAQQLLAPLELKSPKTTNMDVAMLGRELSTVEQAARYARNSEGQAQWFIISNCIEIRLYKYPYSDSIYQQWQIADLTDPNKYAEFVLLLGAKNLLSGGTEKLFNNSLLVEKDITNALYADYRDIRVKLINGMKRENNRIRRAGMVARAQTLLDRVLFIAYAEDRDLLPDKTLNSYVSGVGEFHNAWDMLKLLFTHIDEGNSSRGIPRYNGDLFKPNPDLEDLSISDDLLNALQRLWEYDFDTDVSVTILGHIFEQSIADLDQIYETLDEANDLQLAQQQHGTSGKRKQDGVVYTPDFITTWIVEETLGAYLNKKKSEIQHPEDTPQWWLEYRNILATTRILDPACGSGAFLVAAYMYLKKEYLALNTRLNELGEKGDLFGIELNTDILNNNLFGVDINSESVEIARLSLWLVTAEKGKPLTSLKDNIRQGNSVIADKSVDKGAFSWHGKFKDFDVILGNPPYVRQERLSPIKACLEANYETYHGVADLYTYFFELGLNLLKKGGYMGYISSATFFKTGSGENLRKFLQVNSNLKKVVNFGDLQVFEGVTTYPAILVMEKPARTRTQPPKDYYFNFLNVSSAKVSELSGELKESEFGSMQQSKLALDGWRLEDERLQALRSKVFRNKSTLKEVYGSPLYGIKTGRNEAFVIDRKTRDAIIAQDPQSNEIIKPYLEGKDLKKWHAQPRDLFIIFTRRGINIKQHPAIEAHLEQFRTILEPKPKDWKGQKWAGRKPGKYEWYEIQDTVDYYEMYEEDKIIFAHFQDEPIFFFDQKQIYTNNRGYIFPNTGYFELGLLTSNVMWWIFIGMTSSIRGGFYEATTQRTSTFPIPKATSKEKQFLAGIAKSCQTLAESRYKIQDAFRQRIPDLCPADKEAKLSNKLKSWWTLSFDEFKKEIKSRFKHNMGLKESMEWQPVFDEGKQEIQLYNQQLASKEAELNKAVYDLFGLNAEEITLLEKAIQ